MEKIITHQKLMNKMWKSVANEDLRRETPSIRFSSTHGIKNTATTPSTFWIRIAKRLFHHFITIWDLIWSCLQSCYKDKNEKDKNKPSATASCHGRRIMFLAFQWIFFLFHFLGPFSIWLVVNFRGVKYDNRFSCILHRLVYGYVVCRFKFDSDWL